MKHLLFLICSSFVISHWSFAAERPHILLVMADDMGWGQTGYRGHPVLKTPNLDAMAAGGLRFERFYAGNPVCSPTRAALLTGRTNDRAGVLTHGYALRLQEKTIAQALKAAGYATGHFGKWHLNGYKGPGAPVLEGDPRSPAAFGFDEYVSATNFIDMDPLLGRNGKPEKFTGDSSEIIVAEALRFIEKQNAAKKPTFTVIWYGTSHGPFRASEADKASFQDLPAASADHHGELVAMDRSIGTLRAKLRDLGIAENTLFVFNSDNGGLPDITPNTTGGLRGNKGTVYEGGLRVPGIMEWPSVIKPRITSHPACVTDLLPTIADILELPKDTFPHVLDGVSLKPLFTAETGPRPSPLGFRYGSKAAFISGKLKLVTQDHAKDDFELFDLEADPQETNNLATSQPEIFSRMKQQFQTWNSGVQASFEGKDYAEGKVTPPDPEPINWFEAAPYKPWLEQWSSYWAYQAYFDRAGNPVPKGKPKGKKAKK